MNKTTRNWILIAVVAVLLLAGWGLVRAIGMLGYPDLAIEIERRGADYIFTFHQCRDSHLGAAVYSLQIDELSSDAGIVGNRCSIDLDLTRPGTGQQIAEEWRYGDVPEGWRSTGCAPLERGKQYEIGIIGGGMGERRFRISEDGSVATLSELCR